MTHERIEILESNIEFHSPYTDEEVDAATAQGHRVIVVPVVVVRRSGVSKHIGKDLDGLQYTSTVKGIAEHPLFRQWVREQEAAAQPGGDIAVRVPAAPMAAHGAPADPGPCGSGAGRAGSLAGDRHPGRGGGPWKPVAP